MVILILVVLGLCFGSFVNALVWRIHEQQRTADNGQRLAKKKQSNLTANSYQQTAKDLSILKGRSMCPNCHHTLAWYDLLPVTSWLSLGGKCRYCHKPISWQYPLVELTTALLFVFSYIFWPPIHISLFLVLFPLWLALLTGFVALTVYDLRWMVLPNRIVFPLQVLAVLYVLTLFVVSKDNWHVLSGALLGLLFSAGLFYLLHQVSGGKWIGGGDVKLAVVLGLVLGGATEALLMIFIASTLGSLIGIPLLLAKKTKLHGKLPFGPLLITAAIIVYLFGASLITWYRRQFLLV
jgi:leader peptidase (prepilin peptidase) / N-methyltransferase